MNEEIATIPNEKELAEQAQESYGDDSQIQIPILKVCQPLTKEVRREKIAQAGQFLNSLTQEVFDGPIEFVVVHFEKGRFRANDDNEVICTGREGACGCHEVPYTECPDSEEQYRAAVKRGEKEWGKGPPCATTYNFTGYVLGSDMPVRLSLMRKAAKPAKKLLTLLRFSKAPWDRVYEISTFDAQQGDYDFVGVNVRQGRNTEPDERQAAVNLAQALRTRDAEIVGEHDEAPETEAEREKPADSIDY